MSKSLQTFFAVLIIISGVIWSFYNTRPQVKLSREIPTDQFSTARALEHVKALAKEPHFVGSTAHSYARNYIVSQIEELGLIVETQENYTIQKEGILTRPQNIMTRIKGSGTGKALLLMTHYDSAMHSSPGASDAASGVATILEGIRAYLASGKIPENDIILLFTDAEELGLNGAQLFVEEHPWAADVGLALNFESRGSGGNSFMFLETNDGNSVLIDLFAEADVEYPVTNSLVYSVYKMMPNDTDLSVLREQGDIDGFNFAFIDDHFDYHTATDTPANLDIRTLAHQGSYLMPMLNYLSTASLEKVSSKDDDLFFTFPGFGFVNFPISWILPLLILAGVLLVSLIFLGRYRNRLPLAAAVKGFIPLLLSIVISGLLSYFFWQLMLILYPGYLEMEHGFTYNGYWYIAAVIFLSLAVCFYVYHKFRKPNNTHYLLIAPLILWIIISSLAAIYLEGAAYFILPVFFGLIQLLLLLVIPKISPVIIAFLCLPAIFILMPFIVSFPVALGLGMLFLSGVLIALLFPLLWPVFGYFRNNQMLGFVSFLIFFGMFLTAHFKAEFNEERPRPNSLVYLYDEDLDLATWNTYDNSFDEYTAPFFSEAVVESPDMNWFNSKNGSRFSYSAVAPQIMISKPFISVEKIEDKDPGEETYNVKIAFNRKVNRIDLFTDRNIDFTQFTANGREAGNLQPGKSDLHVFKNRWSDRLLTYYAANQDTLRLQMSLKAGINPEITILEAAYDLHDNPQLRVPPRSPAMIPRPFVMNDAIVVKKTFKLE